MKIDGIPLLQAERGLYELPRGRERFDRYIELMTGGTSEMVAPLTFLNPMGKEHVAASLDALIALDSEAIAETAVREARRRLARIAGELRVALVVFDDVGGGWTDRYLTEVKQRFGNDYEPRHGWAVAAFWTSEAPAAGLIHREVLAAIYRTCWIQQRGVPRTLGEMMEQEGMAALFAGSPPAAFSAKELSVVRGLVNPHRESPHLPVQFACLYGDEAARSVGYPPLGLPPRAGFALALREAEHRRIAPEDLLIATGGVQAQAQGKRR